MAALNIKNVQTGTIALSSSQETNTATITAVVLADTFLLIDWQCASQDIDNTYIRGRLTNTTTVTVDRGGVGNPASVSAIVRYWVIEFDAGLTVTHKTGNGTFNTNIAIGSTVDLGKTFAIVSAKADTATSTQGLTTIGVDIVSTTNFQIVATSTSIQSATDWAVQIVEFDSDSGANVEAATIVMNAVATNTATIGAVTIANCMLIGSSTSNENFGQTGRLCHLSSLDDTTTLRVTRATGSQTETCFCFVIDWGSNVEIQSGTSVITFTEGVSESISITALSSGSTSDAIVFTRGGSFSTQREGGGGSEPSEAIEISLDSTTQITSTRADGSQNSDTYLFQVVDFAGFVPAVGGASLLLLQQSFRQ
jgi:hypothetical protein